MYSVLFSNLSQADPFSFRYAPSGVPPLRILYSQNCRLCSRSEIKEIYRIKTAKVVLLLCLKLAIHIQGGRQKKSKKICRNKHLYSTVCNQNRYEESPATRMEINEDFLLAIYMHLNPVLISGNKATGFSEDIVLTVFHNPGQK